MNKPTPFQLQMRDLEKKQREIVWELLGVGVAEDTQALLLVVAGASLSENLLALQVPCIGHCYDPKDRDDYIDTLHFARGSLEHIQKALDLVEMEILAMPPTFNDDGTEYRNPLLPEKEEA